MKRRSYNIMFTNRQHKEYCELSFSPKYTEKLFRQYTRKFNVTFIQRVIIQLFPYDFRLPILHVSFGLLFLCDKSPPQMMTGFVFYLWHITLFGSYRAIRYIFIFPPEKNIEFNTFFYHTGRV